MVSTTNDELCSLGLKCLNNALLSMRYNIVIEERALNVAKYWQILVRGTKRYVDCVTWGCFT